MNQDSWCLAMKRALHSIPKVSPVEATGRRFWTNTLIRIRCTSNANSGNVKLSRGNYLNQTLEARKLPHTSFYSVLLSWCHQLITDLKSLKTVTLQSTITDSISKGRYTTSTTLFSFSERWGLEALLTSNTCGTNNWRKLLFRHGRFGSRSDCTSMGELFGSEVRGQLTGNVNIAKNDTMWFNQVETLFNCILRLLVKFGSVILRHRNNLLLISNDGFWAWFVLSLLHLSFTLSNNLRVLRFFSTDTHMIHCY